MTRISLSLVAALAISACAHAEMAAPPVSDIASHPALPPPSEAALAAAPDLAITEAPWTQRPSVADFMAVFPARALAIGVGGSVDLDCLAAADHRMACRVRSESPRSYDFGAAAMALSGKLRIAPALDNGQPTAGGKVHWTVDFASSGRRVVTPSDGPHAGP